MKHFSSLLKHKASNRIYPLPAHVPVLLKECLEFLKEEISEQPRIYCDATFGNGGYTRALLESNRECTVIALDQDPTAFERAKEMLSNNPQYT
jgi:16S rRNA (cytosine1402-N4)-methyltransferase